MLTHYLFGGWWQLFRLFRPAELIITQATRPYPLLVASLVGVATIAVAAGVDWTTRETLIITRISPSEAPKIDGLLDDAVWAKTRPVYVRTEQGANLGGTGESLVEARAVHDGQKMYFAFRWEDPTRSLRRTPLIKRADRISAFFEATQLAGFTVPEARRFFGAPTGVAPPRLVPLAATGAQALYLERFRILSA